MRERRVRRRWQVRTEWENIVPADPVLSRELKLLWVTAQRPLRFVSTVVLGTALICVALLVVTSAMGISDDGAFDRQGPCPNEAAKPTRKGQEGGGNADQSPARPRHARGHRENQRRIEATEVDVAAKYPGRLATVNVNEGDEVTAGQVVAHHLLAGNRSPAARRPGAGPESQTGSGRSCGTHRPTQERFEFRQDRL